MWLRFLQYAVPLCLLPAALADQVTLRNGDRVTGAILKKDGKSLTVKSEHFGTVTLPWAEVASIRSDAPLTAVLPGGQAVQGTLATREQQLEIEAAGVRQGVPLADLVALRNADEQRAYERLLRPRWLDLWAGSATLGFAGTQGNAETRTLTAAFNAARVTRADKTSVYFNAIRANALLRGLEATTAQAVRGGLGYSRGTGGRMFVNGFNDYEYDRFQALDLRFVLGGGLGYIAWRGERGRLDLLGGASYNRESFSAVALRPAFSRNSAEAYAGDEFTFKLNPVTSVYQNLRVFPNLSNRGEYRLNFDLGANTRLLRWLAWNVALSNRLLSNPVPGRKTNDILFTTGVGVTFAR